MNDLARILEHVRAVAPHAEIQKRKGQYFAVCPPEEQTAADAAIAAYDDSPEGDTAWEESRIPERRDLKQAAAAVISANKAHLALTNPTAAQLRQQVDALTRQNTAIIKRLIQLQ